VRSRVVSRRDEIPQEGEDTSAEKGGAPASSDGPETARERGGDPLADLADHRLRQIHPHHNRPKTTSPGGERHEEERSQQDQMELVDRNDAPKKWSERERGRTAPRCVRGSAERKEEDRRPPKRRTIRRVFHMDECNPRRGRTRYGSSRIPGRVDVGQTFQIRSRPSSTRTRHPARRPWRSTRISRICSPTSGGTRTGRPAPSIFPWHSRIPRR